jgi:hypothetical protein
MKQLLLILLVVLSLMPSLSLAAEEKVINLPSDAGKWYISVIGEANDAQYKALLSAFDSTDQMQRLKSQVHFLPVTTDTAVYSERYQKNQGKFTINSLPCVRVQTDKGVVVYQANKPNPDTLYQEIAAAVEKEASRFILLPWRRRHNVTPDDIPKPAPAITLVTPPPPLDQDGPPEVEENQIPIFLFALAALAVGVGIGYGASVNKQVHAAH